MDLADNVANNRLQVIADAVDAGVGSGSLKFYEGTVPSPPGAPLTDQILLASDFFSQPAGAVANRVLTFALPPEIMAVEAGTIAFARIVNGSNAWVADLSVGSGDPLAAPLPTDPDIVLDTLITQPGGLIVIVSAAVVE